MKKYHRKHLWLSAIVLTVFAGLIATIPWEAGETVGYLAMGYAGLVTCFLLLQIVGFVVSQTQYNDEIENLKFDVLEIEEAQWSTET